MHVYLVTLGTELRVLSVGGKQSGATATPQILFSIKFYFSVQNLPTVEDSFRSVHSGTQNWQSLEGRVGRCVAEAPFPRAGKKDGIPVQASAAQMAFPYQWGKTWGKEEHTCTTFKAGNDKLSPE